MAQPRIALASLRHTSLTIEYPLNLLQPTSLLPEQFFGPPTEASRGQAERALMRAVLEDAIHCFQKYTGATQPARKRRAQETKAWFWADDYQWPFSFVNICAVLDLDPAALREGLQRWQRTAQRRRHRSPRYALSFHEQRRLTF